MKKMIFYHPDAIVEKPTKGSELRPKKMKEAFENIGYQVDLAVGNSRQRKAAFKRIKKNIKGGKMYDFMYAESSNMPVPFTDSHHLPIRPLQDYFFLKMLNKRKIPVGLFYRDVYWRDNEVKRESHHFKYNIKKLLHWLEWFGIKNTVDHLFLPTTGMGKYLPSKWNEDCLSALYPGCEIKPNKDLIKKEDAVNTKLNLFYVGGIKLPYYDLNPMIKTINQIEGVKLFLCCREKEWNEFSFHYDNLDFNNIEVLHADSSQIGYYYNQSDVFLDLRAPEGYLKNTIPIKIIEAVGYEIPVLVLKGTEYAEFVKKEKTGWVVKTLQDAESLLKKLKDNRESITKKVEKVKEAKDRNSWAVRAEKASTILTNLNSKIKS